MSGGGKFGHSVQNEYRKVYVCVCACACCWWMSATKTSGVDTVRLVGHRPSAYRCRRRHCRSSRPRTTGLILMTRRHCSGCCGAGCCGSSGDGDGDGGAAASGCPRSVARTPAQHCLPSGCRAVSAPPSAPRRPARSGALAGSRRARPPVHRATCPAAGPAPGRRAG